MMKKTSKRTASHSGGGQLLGNYVGSICICICINIFDGVGFYNHSKDQWMPERHHHKPAHEQSIWKVLLHNND